MVRKQQDFETIADKKTQTNNVWLYITGKTVKKYLSNSAGLVAVNHSRYKRASYVLLVQSLCGLNSRRFSFAL